MFKTMCIFAALLSCASWAQAAPVSEQHAWSYQGQSAPEHWASLSNDNATCNGHNQTPINITQAIDADLPKLNIHYPKAKAQTMVNNGHTVQINYNDGGTITVDGELFTLKQMHFHTPSENHINGQSFPMELHLVHANASGGLAVIGVMFEHGKAHPELSKLWQHIPTKKGDSINLLDIYQVSPTAFLPASQDYYRFSGSLTTPPCSEGVRWLVMREPLEASDVQVRNFSDTMGTHTNRPLQPLNGRLIVY